MLNFINVNSSNENYSFISYLWLTQVMKNDFINDALKPPIGGFFRSIANAII